MTNPVTPQVLVVMGVSGSGKSTVAALLAGQLGWALIEGDDLHPRANIEKMKHGIPLEDADREPWLDAIAERIDHWRNAHEPGVLTCSALKRAYRTRLAAGRPDVRFIYLKGDKALIAHRLAARSGHFMPPALLESQFAALEEPGPDEAVLTVEANHTPHEITGMIIGALRRSA